MLEGLSVCQKKSNYYIIVFKNFLHAVRPFILLAPINLNRSYEIEDKNI